MQELTIVITGASRGIGQAIAASFRDQNHHLLLTASTRASFDGNEEGRQFAADFSSTAAIDSLVDDIKQHTDHIDILINNLGGFVMGPFAEASAHDFTQMIDVNFRGPAYFTQQVLPLIQQSKYGQIINISSIGTKTFPDNTALYTAGKSAVSAYSTVLRKELNSDKIRLSVLHPNAVNTWGADDTAGLLAATDIAKAVQFIVAQPRDVQIEEITLSAI